VRAKTPDGSRSPRAERVRHGARSEHVYRRLRDAIHEGQFKSGHRVMENEVADWLKVSRTPVRDAIRRLESEGMLEHEPRNGLVVARLALVHAGVADDEQLVALHAQPRRAAVGADDPAAGLALEHVGLEARAVVEVDHLDLLVGQQVGQLEQVAVDGQAAHVPQVALGHGGAVDLGLHHVALHGG